MGEQLPLSLWQQESVSFAAFDDAANPAAVDFLRGRLAENDLGNVYLYGSHGVGKTHLLLAACHDYANQQRRVAYVNLADASIDLGPPVLEDLASFELVAIDQLDAIISDPQWERALFNLFEQCAANKTSLLFTAATTPQALGLALRDLTSRLARSVIFKLAPLDDERVIELLMSRARARGLEMPRPTAEFMLSRLPRDLHSMMDALDRIDVAALSLQRRASIPLVKEVLNL